MLYRLKPDRTTDWIDHVSRNDFRVVDAQGGDLDRLEWQPAERVADETTLRLALRYGRVSQVGIIVDPRDLAEHDHLTRMRDANNAMLANRPAYRRTLEKMELLIPGTLAAEDAANEAVDESTRSSLKQAEAELRDVLATEPNTELVEHWRGLGGVAPDPI